MGSCERNFESNDHFDGGLCVRVCVGVARHIAPKVICVRAHFLQLQFASSSSGGNICKSLTQPKRVYKPTTKTTAITHIQLHYKHTHAYTHARTHTHSAVWLCMKLSLRGA